MKEDHQFYMTTTHNRLPKRKQNNCQTKRLSDINTTLVSKLLVSIAEVVHNSNSPSSVQLEHQQKNEGKTEETPFEKELP